jgi:hypothetical protein
VKCLLWTVLVVLAFLVVGCSETGTDSGDSFITSDATVLLGLQDDFECRYVRYDSTVTYPPYEITVDTTFFTFAAIATDSARQRFELWFDSLRTAALKIQSGSILHLGYIPWSPDEPESLVSFAEPPMIFPLRITAEETWSFYTPSTPDIFARLYLSWGFEVTRTFDRRETLILPIGTFNCYVFVTEYRLPGTDTLFQTCEEYYASDWGLVKLYSTGPGTSRVFMVSRETDPAYPVR